ncbi:MAG: anhydro-N-acetylmuramic acid kinase [Caulobacterales bacterium 32-69-10]|nr:MAG: anhydro-N-acetylmuramic acid kinase [Caulobacterales bacterium 32-69-10]
MRVLGFMSGTSLDAVDMAILETDGEAIQAFGPAGERKLTDATRNLALQATEEAKAWARGTPPPAVFEATARAVADEHYDAASQFLAANGLQWSDLELVGLHGQTVLHERPTKERVGRTVQLADGQRLADRAGVPVAFDFRTADVAAGGEGAPLAPIYHAAWARAAGLEPPSAVLNLGGVANITLLPRSGQIAAFDTGPANGMIDLLVQGRGHGRYDAEGALARAGEVDAAVLAGLLAHPYFAAPWPKSLDRYDFPVSAVDGLSLQDAAATLVAFTAETVALGVEQLPEQPRVLVMAGGGRRNPAIVEALKARLSCEVASAEDYGWRGDAVEAEAFAYLAARTWRGLPISFPGTTGVKQPMTGGRIARPTPSPRHGEGSP